MTVIWERGDLRGEIEASYNGRTGERTDLRLRIVRTGPRGGTSEVWSGAPGAASRMMDDLRELFLAAMKVPYRIDGAPDED